MEPVAIDVGNPLENPTTLCSQDWYLPFGNPPWNFNSINRRPSITGPWHVMVQQDGTYRITLRQLPKEANTPLVAERASLTVAGETHEVNVLDGSSHVHFTVNFPAGKTELITQFWNSNEPDGGAYFTDVEFLEAKHAP